MNQGILEQGAMVGDYRVEALLRDEAGIRLYRATRVSSSAPAILSTAAWIDGAPDADELLRRVELVKGLAHPHVAGVLDAGVHADTVYVARERVAGVDLRTRVEQHGAIPAETAVEIIGQVGEALVALRAAGLAQGMMSLGDVTVANIGSEQPPHAVVTDVGLAPARAGDGAAPRSADRDDVSILGALLLEALTGWVGRGGHVAVLRERRALLPTSLWVVIRRAIAPDVDQPGDAFPNGAALVAAAGRAARNPNPGPLLHAFDPALAADVPLRDERDGDDEHRFAYGLLHAQRSVVEGRQFELAVGLSPIPDAQVAGEEPLPLPPADRWPLRLTVSVYAEAKHFTLARGESWRVEMDVTAKDPYPHVILHLTARAGASASPASEIRATYVIDGQPIGRAVRPIGIATPDGHRRATPIGLARTTAMPSTLLWEAPDLTVEIWGDEELKWSYMTHPRHEIATSDTPEFSHIGQHPADFVRQFVARIPDQEHGLDLDLLTGIGDRVANLMPLGFWEALGRIGKRVRTPTVLINTQEPHIPWELALMREPFDDRRLPFLAAQTIVGRWVPGEPSTQGARTRPPQQPPRPKDPARGMAVIVGAYGERAGWPRLRYSTREGNELRRRYGAVRVRANARSIAELLKTGSVDVIHVAMHARGGPGRLFNGLVTNDGQPLAIGVIEGLTFDSERPPFVFLNACEAGAGFTLLGQTAGIAQAFLRAGAAGVVAPLWEIGDKIAARVPPPFYARAFGDGVQVADHFRDQWTRFEAEDEPLRATHLAYVFYGHPRMLLRAERPTVAGA
jgi:hypothetical protein